MYLLQFVTIMVRRSTCLEGSLVSVYARVTAQRRLAGSTVLPFGVWVMGGVGRRVVASPTPLSNLRRWLYLSGR
jgi:hypothetical protein